MRNLNLLDIYRNTSQDILKYYGSFGDHETGVFRVPSSVDKKLITIIASVGDGWDHVSVSRVDRCPDWTEMEQVKRLFFKDDETAMQLHLPPSDHISVHPHCLHLWRPLEGEIPRPPPSMVA